jgi:hypothetical protein
MIACRKKLTSWAVEHAKDSGEEVEKRMNGNINVTLGITLGMNALSGLVLLLGVWYRRSGNTRTDKFEESLIREDHETKKDERMYEAKKRSQEKKEFYRKKYGI